MVKFRHCAFALYLAALVCSGCGRGSSAPGTASTEAKDWCAEHGIAESDCTKCDPTLTAKFKEAGDWCPEHGFPESKCPQCKTEGGHRDTDGYDHVKETGPIRAN